LNASLQALSTKFAALKQRERWMVFIAGIAVIYGVINTLALDPMLKKQQALTTDLAQSQLQLSDLRTQITTIQQNPVVDIDRDNQQKIAALNATVQTQQQQLNDLQSNLVSPERMPALLKNLIRNDANLVLVSMKTLTPENFLIKKGDALQPNTGEASSGMSKASEGVIYKHALSLTLAGNYLDLLHYAESLQALSNQVLWESAVLTSKEHPVNELTMTVYTLSLDKTWLSI
jgi:MSHA biogenesis protein MshJ